MRQSQTASYREHEGRQETAVRGPSSRPPHFSTEPWPLATVRRADALDPQAQFCPKEHCIDKGIRGQGNVRIHSYREGAIAATSVGVHLARRLGRRSFGCARRP